MAQPHIYIYIYLCGPVLALCLYCLLHFACTLLLDGSRPPCWTGGIYLVMHESWWLCAFHIYLVLEVPFSFSDVHCRRYRGSMIAWWSTPLKCVGVGEESAMVKQPRQPVSVHPNGVPWHAAVGLYGTAIIAQRHGRRKCHDNAMALYWRYIITTDLSVR